MNLALAGKLNLALSAIGATVFAALFLYVAITPENFDTRVRGFAMARAQVRIEDELNNRLPPETREKVSRLVAAAASKARQAIGRLEGTAIGDLTKNQYRQVMDRLRQDVQIFAGTSFLAFAFAGALVLFRGKAARHLLPISLALSVSTLLAILWYVF